MSKHCRILALILSLTTLFCALPALGDGLPKPGLIGRIA